MSSYILPRSKNGVQQKCIVFAELDLKSAKLGPARSSFISNLKKTLITMKLTTKSSSGIFKKVPELLQRSTDTLILEGLFRHFPGWYGTTLGFALFSGSFGCLWVSGTTEWTFCKFSWFFYYFRTCRVDHLEWMWLFHTANFEFFIEIL